MAQAPPCPYCGALSYRRQDQRWLICQECGHEFDIQRDLCLACGYLNREDVSLCSNCQADLKKDAVARIIEARAKNRKQWREEYHSVQMEQAKRDAESSEQAMEAFWTEEQARREAFARARVEAEKRERRTLTVVGIVGAVAIVLLIVASLIITLVLPALRGASTTVPVPSALGLARVAGSSFTSLNSVCCL
jgi:hypothetical protein